jgi:hypothetical protein
MSHLDDNNDELTRELRNRSEDVGGHPIDFDSVRRTAQGIQRRRRIVGGIAAAAVLAVAVPAGMAASSSLDLGQDPAGQPTTTVSVTTPDSSATEPTATEPTATEEPTPSKPLPTQTASGPTQTSSQPTSSTIPTPPADPSAGKTVDLTAAGAVRGADPAIAYIDGPTLHVPDAPPLDLGVSYYDFAPHRGGWIALGSDDSGNRRLFFLDADGVVQDSAATTSGGLAVNADGDYVGYALQDGVVKLAPTSDVGETYTFNLDAPGPVTPVAVGPVSTKYAEPSCVVFYNVDGREREATVADCHGIVDTLRPLIHLTGRALDGSLAGIVSVSDTGSCSQVRNGDSARSKRWETCDFALDRFSPDGRYVLARSAYFDGLGDSQVTILDAQTGNVVVSYQRPRNSALFVEGIAWEDSSHALTTVYEDGAWHILRLDLDGKIEVASSAVKADEVSSPFRFGTTP